MVRYPYLLYKQEFKLKSKRVIIQQGEKEHLNSLQLLYAQLQLDSFEQFDSAGQKNTATCLCVHQLRCQSPQLTVESNYLNTMHAPEPSRIMMSCSFGINTYLQQKEAHSNASRLQMTPHSSKIKVFLLSPTAMLCHRQRHILLL